MAKTPVVAGWWKEIGCISYISQVIPYFVFMFLFWLLWRQGSTWAKLQWHH